MLLKTYIWDRSILKQAGVQELSSCGVEMNISTLIITHYPGIRGVGRHANGKTVHYAKSSGTSKAECWLLGSSFPGL